MERNEMISKIAKYTSTVLVAPIIGAGTAIGGVALAGYYFLKNIPFKNWKTTSLTALAAGVLFFNSDTGAPTRELISKYMNNSLHKKVTNLELEVDFLTNKNENLKYIFQERTQKITDSLNSIRKIEQRTFKELYLAQVTKIAEKTELQNKKQNKNNKRISNLEENQKTIVDFLQINTKKIEKFDRLLQKVQIKNLKRRNKDITNLIDKLYTKDNYSHKPETKTYWITVNEGESLGQIATKYYGSWKKFKKIATLNGLENPNKIEIGQPIRLPSYGLIRKENLNKSKFPSKTIILHKGDNLTTALMQKYGFSQKEAIRKAKETVKYNKLIGNEYATTNKIKQNTLIISMD